MIHDALCVCISMLNELEMNEYIDDCLSCMSVYIYTYMHIDKYAIDEYHSPVGGPLHGLVSRVGRLK